MSNRYSFWHFFDQAVRQAADAEIRRREDAERSYQAEQYEIYRREKDAYDAEHCLGDYSEREEC